MFHAAAPAADHTVTIVLSTLGGLYGIVVVTAIIVVCWPRRTAVRPAVGSSMVVRAARPPSRGVRWSPSHGEVLVRTRLGAYAPRDGFEMERRMRAPARPTYNHGFLHANQVFLYCMSLCLCHRESHIWFSSEGLSGVQTWDLITPSTGVQSTDIGLID